MTFGILILILITIVFGCISVGIFISMDSNDEKAICALSFTVFCLMIIIINYEINANEQRHEMNKAYTCYQETLDTKCFLNVYDNVEFTKEGYILHD